MDTMTTGQQRNNCAHCDEPITGDDYATGGGGGGGLFHRECAFRLVAGSVGHIMGICPCNGGDTCDPPGFTVREAARFAFDVWREGNPQ